MLNTAAHSGGTARMSSVSIADYRLNNQRIAGQGFDQPEDVVRWMGALQAQDYAQAVWALGLRMRSPSAHTACA